MDKVIDLFQLLFNGSMPKEPATAVIMHVNSSIVKSEDKSVHVLSDIDDTLYLNLIDNRYPSKTVYPGVIQFYNELAASDNALHFKVGSYYEDGELITNRGAGSNVTFLSARPGFLVGRTKRKVMNTVCVCVCVYGEEFYSLTSTNMYLTTLHIFLQTITASRSGSARSWYVTWNHYEFVDSRLDGSQEA